MSRLVGRRKITLGFVTQIYNDEGQCIDQDITLSEREVEWENEDGEAIAAPNHIAHPIELKGAIPDKRKREYVRLGGHSCPHCGSKNIEGGSYDTQDEMTCRPCTCRECGKSWQDEMTLTGVTFDEEEGPAQQPGDKCPLSGCQDGVLAEDGAQIFCIQCGYRWDKKP